MTKIKGPGRPKGTFKGEFPVSVNGKRRPVYSRWAGMISRCTNPNSHIWKYYGGRGVTVAPEWLGFDGYQQFCRDMGDPPAGKWLERKDNSLGYSKSNCCWATPKEQARNREQGGKKNINPASLRQRSIAAGIAYHVVYQRINLRGWDESEALSTPTRKHRKHRRHK